MPSLNEPRYCFSYLPNGVGQYKIIKCKEGEKGYIEMHYKHYEEEAEIKAEVAKMNKEFYGLEGAEIARISISTL
jgi:hypothetical protein